MIESSDLLLIRQSVKEAVAEELRSIGGIFALAQDWVPKNDICKYFSRSERTVENWVQLGKIKKKKGQDLYSIKSKLEYDPKKPYSNKN